MFGREREKKKTLHVLACVAVDAVFRGGEKREKGQIDINEQTGH